MNNACYQELAEYLDRLPGGFGPSHSGAEIHLLQHLYTVKEADLAIHLTLDREEARVIAGRAGLPTAEVEQRLDEMSRKGLIFSTQPVDGSALYHAVPWIVGIYEFQVNRMSEELLRLLDDYWSTAIERPNPETIPQMRTIPVNRSIDPQLETLPYEQVDELVAANDRFAVAPCICRRHARLLGGGCDAPEESCLVFGEWADYYVRDGRGRSR